MALDFGRRREHEGDDKGFDLLLLGFGDSVLVVGRGIGGPSGLEVVFEVDGGGLPDLVIDGGFGDKAEDGEAVVGLLRDLGKRSLGAAARLRGWRESVEEALREEL